MASSLPPDKKVQLLSAEIDDGVSVLWMALENGNKEVVKTMVEQVLASELPHESKIALLTAKTHDGVPGLYMAFQNGHAAALESLWSRYWHQACHLMTR